MTTPASESRSVEGIALLCSHWHQLQRHTHRGSLTPAEGRATYKSTAAAQSLTRRDPVSRSRRRPARCDRVQVFAVALIWNATRSRRVALLAAGPRRVGHERGQLRHSAASAT